MTMGEYAIQYWNEKSFKEFSDLTTVCFYECPECHDDSDKVYYSEFFGKHVCHNCGWADYDKKWNIIYRRNSIVDSSVK